MTPPRAQAPSSVRVPARARASPLARASFRRLGSCLLFARGLIGSCLLFARGLIADLPQLTANGDGVVLFGRDRQQGAGHGGRDLRVDLVGGHLQQRLVGLHFVADLLQPAGDRPLGDRLAQFWHLHRRRLAAARRRRCRLRFGLRLWLGLPGLLRLLGGRLRPCAGLLGRLLLIGGLLLGLLVSARLAVVAYDRQLAAHLNGVVFLGDDLFQHTGSRRRDFGVDLVGGHFEQRLVAFHRVALLLEPTGHGAFGHALTECWHLHGEGHVC